MDISAKLVHVKVCDLLNNMGDWEWQKIKAIFPPKTNFLGNEFLFAGAGREGFSVNNMYASLVNQDVINDIG